MAIDVVAALEPLLDVLHVALFELAAVLVTDAHLAVLDLDARLEVQEVGAHGHERRAAAAALEILQRVDHEADIELLALFLQRRCDVGRVHALLGHLGRVEHQVADAGREVARVHGVDVRKLLRRDAGVLVAGGHVARDREVDHGVIFLPARGEVRQIVRHVHRRGLAELARRLCIFVELLRVHVDAVTQGLLAADDVQRRNADVVALDQLRREIARAVGRNFDLHGFTFLKTGKCAFILTHF